MEVYCCKVIYINKVNQQEIKCNHKNYSIQSKAENEEIMDKEHMSTTENKL